MLEFADATGLSGRAPPRRYLWTDAFAVCNFLGLFRQTGEDRFLRLARNLVDQVHHVLGRHRNDDPRQGWISGLSDDEGERHPTSGGLRIGKKLNERRPDEPPDSQLEWDQDGQYFHYLTKWVHALSCMSRETGELHYLRWAIELAETAHRAFTDPLSPGGPQRMVWKMSIDLTRPLVPSMGHHDPLDGLVSSLELQTDKRFDACDGPDLSTAITDFTRMCEQSAWATEDPLGLGGLLDDAARLADMVFDRGLDRHGLLYRLLAEADLSLRAFSRSPQLTHPAEHRLAFRELGLSIGIRGVERIRSHVESDRDVAAMMDHLLQHGPLADTIQSFWSDPLHRLNETWTDHHDINSVMLATSIAPEGYFPFDATVNRDR